MPAPSAYIERAIEKRVADALKEFRVVGLFGPRQSGKSTMLMNMAANDSRREYLSLDDTETLGNFGGNTDAFVREHPMAIVDEIHLSPDLVRSIKSSVDRDQSPGRYIITSSLSPHAMAHVSDSLVGRMQVVRMLPLSQAEIRSLETTFLEMLARGEIPAPADMDVVDLIECIAKGGYPGPVLADGAEEVRERVDAILELVNAKDLKAESFDMYIPRMLQLNKVLRQLADQSGGLLNTKNLHQGTGFARPTAYKLIQSLARMGLIALVPRHADSEAKRQSLRPKVEFVDTGILSALLDFPGRGSTGGTKESPKAGGKFAVAAESFVYSELLKQHGFMGLRGDVECYRDEAGKEIDFVVTLADGSILAIEVKTSYRLRRRDFAAIIKFAKSRGRRFRFGIVLFPGKHAVPWDDEENPALDGKLWALPLSCLFSGKAL